MAIAFENPQRLPDRFGATISGDRLETRVDVLNNAMGIGDNHVLGGLFGHQQVSFTSDQLSAAIKADLFLSAEVQNVLPAIERALMFLHEQHVIELQNGLAILRQAMTIHLARTGRGRYYSKGDFKPLAVHYREKRLQVHVMMRYATLALEKIAGALTLVLDYFALGRVKFINKYFEGEKDIPGLEPDEHRDRLLAGCSHILVDEYQDIEGKFCMPLTYREHFEISDHTHRRYELL